MKTVKEAAVMADDYELTHKFGNDYKTNQGRSWCNRRPNEQRGSFNKDNSFSQGSITEFSVDSRSSNSTSS